MYNHHNFFFSDKDENMVSWKRGKVCAAVLQKRIKYIAKKLDNICSNKVGHACLLIQYYDIHACANLIYDQIWKTLCMRFL